MILDDLKVLLNVNETKESILTLYIRKAKTLISNYLNSKSTLDIETLYPDAVIEYVIINYTKRGNEGIKQFSQGSRSGTYGDDLPDSVKALLPLPSVRMMG
jgi:hypothetical protein